MSSEKSTAKLSFLDIGERMPLHYDDCWLTAAVGLLCWSKLERASHIFRAMLKWAPEGVGERRFVVASGPPQAAVTVRADRAKFVVTQLAPVRPLGLAS